MAKLLTRRRLSMGFAILGLLLMGTDLILTRNFFVHIGELMVATLLCLLAALVIDATPRKRSPDTPS